MSYGPGPNLAGGLTVSADLASSGCGNGGGGGAGGGAPPGGSCTNPAGPPSCQAAGAGAHILDTGGCAGSPFSGGGGLGGDMPFGGGRQYVLDDIISAPWPWVPVILSNPSCGIPPQAPPGGPVPPPLPAAGGAYSQTVTITSGPLEIEGMMIYCSTSGESHSSTCAGVLFSHNAPGTFQYTLYAGLGTVCGSCAYTARMGGNSASVPNPPVNSVVMNVT